MTSKGLGTLCTLLPFFIQAQTIEGYISDAHSGQPLESVAVYFDNTTLGTTTNAAGFFSLDYSDAIQSTLVISYLGYEKVFISDYRNESTINIKLKESASALETVYLEYDDGLTREQKLILFRKEFLGASEFGKSCTIKNEEDLILRYDQKDQSLTASALKPIVVVNRALGYRVRYDIKEFEASFRFLDFDTDDFVTSVVMYLGTSFYENVDPKQKRRILKNREQAYLGSVQHFMRALFNLDLKTQKFEIYHQGFVQNPWNFIQVNTIEGSDFKKVSLKEEVTILYDRELQSELQLDIPHFFIDQYGNYSPIQGVLFSGYMGFQRVGDLLPSDYKSRNK